MMSVVEGSVSNDAENQTSNGKDSPEGIANEVLVPNKQNNENLRCFVCDSVVKGRCYSLATCKTQSSRARVIEKLGELVGERYVVVINEDDIVCRSCANLINTLDRLETEMKRVKTAVLTFLECKYSLAQGELLESTNAPKPGQPPHITRSESRVGDYHSRKRGPLAIDEVKGGDKKKKKSIWMQCDKCRYTTLYNTFMVHHVRQHLKQKIRCDKCGLQFPGAKPIRHWCTDHRSGDNSAEAENPEKEPQPIQTAPLETIDLTGTVEDVDIGGNLPILTIQPNLKTLAGPVKDEQIELINLTNPNTLQFQNFISNTSSKDSQPMLMRVLQQLGVNEDLDQLQNTLPVTSGESGVVVASTNNSSKQMLALTEDGSLKMVSVDWEDVNPSEAVRDITF